MFKPALELLAQFILTHNTYLSKGFGNCWLDEETGNVFGELCNDGGITAVFPADKHGDYFYIRQQKRANLNDDPRFAFSDTARLGVLATSMAVLVAVVSNADEMKLIENLVNTLGKYTPGIVRPVSILWEKDTVLRSEMKGAESADIEAALQRLNKQSIVAVEFAISVELNYQRLDCMQSPCK